MKLVKLDCGAEVRPLTKFDRRHGVQELDVALHIAAKFGYCDASRLLVRPKSGMLALMVEYEDGAKEWYHILPRMLESINKRLARRVK